MPPLNDVILFLKRAWYEPLGLVIAMGFGLFATAGLLVAASSPWWIHLVIHVLVCAKIHQCGAVC